MDYYEQALIYAAIAHGDQKRKYTGEPYIVHAIRVASMVKTAEIYVSRCETIQAALLHDVLEDTHVTYEELAAQFGEITANLVAEISDVSKPTDGNRKARKEINLRHLSAASRNAQNIKVCDIMDNAQNVRQHDPEFARVYIPEKLAQLDVLRLADPRLIEKARLLVSP